MAETNRTVIKKQCLFTGRLSSKTLFQSSACFWLLLLNYHKRLGMISEALELYVEGGRVSHSWCMCIIGHSYDGLVACREIPEHILTAR